MAPSSPPVIVVGAGMAGLAAARHLARHGHSVTVVERGDEVGGRMAVHRIGAATFDHGAQFFTTRSPQFTELVDEAVTAGAVTEWSRGFQVPDPYPRYRGTSAMNDLARWMARGVKVELGCTVTALHHRPAAAYVLTPPVPEALAILALSDLLPHPDLTIELGRLAYRPTITAMAVLDRSSALAAPGGWQYADDPHLSFVADNQVKGISTLPAVTIHLSNALSAELWDEADDAVLDRTLDLASTHLGRAMVVEVQLRRWRYAGPVEVWPQRTVTWGDDPFVALAGEMFGGPKVEGAFLSGLAAAEAVLAHLR